jgi:hypothetical protein
MLNKNEQIYYQLPIVMMLKDANVEIVSKEPTLYDATLAGCRISTLQRRWTLPLSLTPSSAAPAAPSGDTFASACNGA